MSALDAIGELLTVFLPEFLGERTTGLVLRGGRGRWERVAMGDRKRSEDAVRFLRRNQVSAWIRPASRKSYEVVVRTDQAEIARGLLNAPSAGWQPI
jgi:hypothetical protein